MAGIENRATSGVYLTEAGAFPVSVVGVATAVPIFVGYTEKSKSRLAAVPIGSMADYTATFGAGHDAKYAVESVARENSDFRVGDGFYRVTGPRTAQYNLFNAVKLFYANGGGQCWIVSVGDYAGIVKQDLLDGLAVAADVAGPTMLIVPDACILEEEGAYADVTTTQINQCGMLGDRVAILDLPGAMDPESWTSAGLAAQRDRFHADVEAAAHNLGYGAAYAPALRTSVLGANDVDYTNLQATQAGSDMLKGLLEAQNVEIFGAGTAKAKLIQSKLDLAFPVDIEKNSVAPEDVRTLDRFLTNALPLLLQVQSIVATKLNVAPPSGAIAGVCASNDIASGVWAAPAGITPMAVVAPEVAMTDAQQAAYTLPGDGKAINILRDFPGRGTVVWGARTLDGNSPDYRYIQVRRTLIYIEQSIKNALNQFAFAANDKQTWTAVTATISSFLNGLWQEGALMGAYAKEAYNVQCGLGTTMTERDILDGTMIVAMTLSLMHPAEFIVLTITQPMQGSE